MKMFTTFILFILIVTFHVPYINGQAPVYSNIYTGGPLGEICATTTILTGLAYCAGTAYDPTSSCIPPDNQLLGLVCDNQLPCCVYNGAPGIYTNGPLGFMCRLYAITVSGYDIYQSTGCQASPTCPSGSVTAGSCDGGQTCCGIYNSVG